jgi:hypothetical protein
MGGRYRRSSAGLAKATDDRLGIDGVDAPPAGDPQRRRCLTLDVSEEPDAHVVVADHGLLAKRH